MIEDGVTGLLADPTSPKISARKSGVCWTTPIWHIRLADNARKVVAQRFFSGDVRHRDRTVLQRVPSVIIQCRVWLETWRASNVIADS